MCDQQTNDLLLRIANRLDSDEYEQGGIYTLGGPAGLYQLRSPYNTECEYLVIGAYLAAVSGNGVVVVSNNNAGLNTFSLGQSLGSSTNGSDMNNAFDGVVLPTSATINSLIAVDHWQPMGRGASIYVYVTGTASYALIALKRRLDRSPVYANAPRIGYPHTHTQRQSTRYQRSLPAMSPMALGAESRYPVPGGKPYSHDVSPDNPNMPYLVDPRLPRPKNVR